ncbi:MAG TPA: TetR/AcrR family transcriptional regulator [Ktedonobacteraceae bacterium]|jgi:AcrR family transcriptional regulator|nr:TetR/AcrR family transcriptional regulator [Ktedonobacteraceae bacterium]
MAKQSQVIARERVLEAAERLFAGRGYAAVTLRDIGQAVGIKHASLYYHFPRGKEELYVEVTARRMQRYREGLERAIASARNGWYERLEAAANWMLAQPTMYLGRMMQSDMPAISDEAAEQLRKIVYSSLLQPLVAIFQNALQDNPEKLARSATYAGMFLSLIEGIDNLPASYVQGSKQELVKIMLDMLSNGIVGK